MTTRKFTILQPGKKEKEDCEVPEEMKNWVVHILGKSDESIDVVVKKSLERMFEDKTLSFLYVTKRCLGIGKTPL